MYYDTQRTKICKDVYRPSSNLIRLVKSMWAIIMTGQSPIGHDHGPRMRHH